ncbi:DPBB and LysM peptidoglycan-binding domain-containing protein [Sphingobacterium hotanense]|uniref:LysM peptidoglycan-binding domain-containing protein n=2 Tax=Sphingobacteriaceae TaxID=84566 RepID=A0ABT7NPN1_9SPHI|nr:LysM peptidoglycan-binding domain-containing protein [Sphingobacterium hotanense]MDM1049081.1 LysM peptidoglycan-binding domain-containing protein [Sphingobacterium hotanense]
MKKQAFKFQTLKKSLIIFSTCFVLMGVATAQAQTNNSQKTETINGKTFIIHTIAAKDTYYQLSRQYGVPVKTIMSANNQKNLRLGDVVRIPSTAAPVETPAPKKDTTREVINTVIAEQSGQVLTQYKVGPNETLYSIAKRFATNVESIKSMNNLTSDVVREGQTLKIPDGKIAVQEPTPTEPIELPIPDVNRQQEIEFETNRYGIREKKEKGIGIWMDNLESRGKSNLALHRTAPVGTILKITNPLTKNITFAKVVGKFSDTADSRDAIVILSKSAASHIGAFDKRFLIEITYGAPIEN